MARRKTAEEKQRLGNPGRRPIASAPESAAPVLDVMPPAGITDGGRAVWMLLAPALIDMKILRATDALAFTILCETFAEYIEARKQLAADGYVYDAATVAGGVMKRVHPLYIVISRARRDVLAYGAQFGITPIDRMRVIQHLAGGAGLPPPPDPRAHSAADGDDDERDLLDAAPLQDTGPIGSLN